MKNFTIKVTEHREGLFVVEAEDENDALERLGRIIETDCFWNDFENGGEYSLSTEVETDGETDDSIGEWSDEDYRDMPETNIHQRASVYPMPFFRAISKDGSCIPSIIQLYYMPTRGTIGVPRTRREILNECM